MKTFGAFLVSLVVCSAAPTTPSTVSIPVTHNPNFTPNGALELARAYGKFGTPIPPQLKSAVSKILSKRDSGTGSVDNTPIPSAYDREYIATVDIGTPAQQIPLDFDTGSSDLWVFSTETPSNEVKGQKLWYPSKSSTAKKLSGYSWKISYADGSGSSGDVYDDVVTIGGLTVQQQAVESAQQVSAQFTNGPPQASGLLGLGFDNINRVSPQQQKTWFSNIKGSLKAPLFTSYLKKGAAGTYNFGYIDDKQYTGNITYTAVDSSRGYWGWTATGYSIGGTGGNKNGINGIADTGTSLLLLPDSIVQDYWSQVQGSSFNQDIPAYVFPCGTSLPDFTFGVEDSSITIPGSYMSYGNADDSGQSCFGGIQSNNGGLTIFGDIALKASFVVYDDGNKQLGWAQQA